MDKLIKDVYNFGLKHGLMDIKTPKAQLLKIQEEVFEAAEAMGDFDHFKTEIGDILHSTITLICQQGFNVDDCLKRAIEKNKDRTGKIVNGSFVKDEN
jgi:NTP pyrophosphatase (non-canonical NTP hydrolase)